MIIKKFKFSFKSLIKAWPIFVILLLSGAAVWLANQYLTSKTAEVEERLFDQAAKSKIKVVVPIRNLLAGEELSIATLATREVPREYVNSDALTQESIASYEGKKLVRSVTKGTPLLASFIAAYEFKPFSTTIADGTRAITIPVDEINSVSGMLTVGDKVDLLVMMQAPIVDAPNARQDMQLVPLLEGVTVQATGTFTKRELLAQSEQPERPTNGNRPAGSYNTITIAVLPRDAQKVVLAQQSGRIVALLRRPDDAAMFSQSLSTSEAFGYVQSKPPPRGPMISYIVGGSFSTGSQGLQAEVGVNPTSDAGGLDMQALTRLLQSNR